ncbi:MAG: CHAD domain-containing protein [Phycisphaerae bacterium]|nr:CHAD domain-containing protein [Phycisphaerae bacterium]
MSPTDGLLKFITKHLERLDDSLTRVMATRDIESVHILRVSSRRLSEPLELLAGFFGRKRCLRLRSGLGDIRDALRRVRDVDVLRLAIAGDQSGFASDPEDLAKLQGVLAIERESDLIAARHQIERADPSRVLRVMDALCEKLRGLESRRDEKDLLRAARRLWQEKAKRLIDRPPTREHGPGLHKTRIRLKAFRYSTELVCRLDGQTRDDLLKASASMQDRLGAWNDHFCAARMLGQIAQDEQTLSAGPLWCASVLEFAARRARAMTDELGEIMISWPRLRRAIEADVFGRPDRSGSSVTAKGKVASSLERATEGDLRMAGGPA